MCTLAWHLTLPVNEGLEDLEKTDDARHRIIGHSMASPADVADESDASRRKWGFGQDRRGRAAGRRHHQ